MIKDLEILTCRQLGLFTSLQLMKPAIQVYERVLYKSNYQLDLDDNNNNSQANLSKILKIITFQEVRKAIEKLKTGKSAGEDKILNECLRAPEP